MMFNITIFIWKGIMMLETQFYDIENLEFTAFQFYTVVMLCKQRIMLKSFVHGPNIMIKYHAIIDGKRVEMWKIRVDVEHGLIVNVHPSRDVKVLIKNITDDTPRCSINFPSKKQFKQALENGERIYLLPLNLERDTTIRVVGPWGGTSWNCIVEVIRGRIVKGHFGHPGQRDKDWVVERRERGMVG